MNGFIFSVVLAMTFISGPSVLAHEGHTEEGVSKKYVTVTGKLKAVRSDDFKNKKSLSDYTLTDESTGKEYILHFTSNAPTKLKHGVEMTITARDMGGNNLYLGANDGTSVQITGATTLAAAGDQRAVVLMVNISSATVGCSQTQVHNMVFADPGNYSMSSLYRETSFGNLTISGETYANINISGDASACSPDAWASAADAKASELGIQLSNFPRRIYVLPATACTWAGLGTLGGNVSRSWVNGQYCGYHDVYAHEFGHNIGMHHSGVQGGNEYADTSDIMGYAGVGLRQVNGPHKIQMGWLPSTSVATVGNGSYSLAPLEAMPGTLQGYSVLKIAKPDTGETYFLSYRRPIGFDSILNGNYVNRLNIHTHRGGSSMTYFITSLGAGETFTDSANGINIRADSINETFLSVSVNTICVTNSPSLAISPSMQGGAAGATLNYTVTVVNRDSAGCGQSRFDLTSMIPSGFASSLSANALTLAAGQSGTSSISVTSPPGTASGSYTFSAMANDASVAGHSSTGSATYMVDGEAPTQPMNLVGTIKKRKQVSLTWSPSTDNVRVVKYQVYRNGTVVAESTSNSYSQTVAFGTYTYYVRALDAANNASSPSNSVTVSVGR
jgi:hypothetical protein